MIKNDMKVFVSKDIDKYHNNEDDTHQTNNNEILFFDIDFKHTSKTLVGVTTKKHTSNITVAELNIPFDMLLEIYLDSLEQHYNVVIDEFHHYQIYDGEKIILEDNALYEVKRMLELAKKFEVGADIAVTGKRIYIK